MDFEPRYTPEQEAFRREVQAWLKESVPTDLAEPADPADLSYEQYQKRPWTTPLSLRRNWIATD
jgi:hypothetical protein